MEKQVARQRKDAFRLEQEREKLGGELSEAQNMYMQSLEDVKVSLCRTYPLGRSRVSSTSSVGTEQNDTFCSALICLQPSVEGRQQLSEIFS